MQEGRGRIGREGGGLQPGPTAGRVPPRGLELGRSHGGAGLWVDTINDPTATPNEKLAAARDMLDRALGKPVAPTAEVEMPTETDRELDAMTPEQREELLRRNEAQRGGSLLRLVEDA